MFVFQRHLLKQSFPLKLVLKSSFYSFRRIKILVYGERQQRQRNRLLPHRAIKQYKEQTLYEDQHLQWEFKDNDVNS